MMNAFPLEIGALRIAVIPVTPFQQNCLLLWNEDTRIGAVLDPGGDAELIAQTIKKHSVTVDKIVLTHGHLDHAGGVVNLQRVLAADSRETVPVEGPHLADKLLLDSLPTQGRMFGWDNLHPVSPDRWLDDGDSLEIAGYTFDVRHCPGHTPGHVVFVQMDLKLALVGDVLFRQSVGRTDFPYGSHDDLIASIEAKLLVLPDDVQFICGHGPGSSIGAERCSNPFLKR